MRKLVKWFSIIVAALIFLLVIGVVALPFLFPLEKIKAYAVDRLSEALNREVKIEKVSFNLFSGIRLEKLYVGNRKGFSDKPFVSANAIELHYAFWPLFSRQIIINELKLVRPEILIEKNRAGEFNFSDLTKAKAPNKASKVPAVAKKEAKLPFSLFMNNFSVSGGRLTYTDHSTNTTSAIREINIGVAGFALGLIKPIDLHADAVIDYQGKEVPVSAGASVALNLEKESVNLPNLTLTMAGEKIGGGFSLTNFRKLPQVDFNLSSSKFSVDPFLAIFAASGARPKEKAKKGELTRTVNQATKSIPAKLIVNGTVNIDNLSFQNIKVDRVALAASLASKQLKLSIKQINFYAGTLSGKAAVDLSAPGLAYSLSDLKLVGFNAHLFSNAAIENFLVSLPDYQDLIDKVYGALDLSLSLRGRGVEPQDILANTQATGSFKLKDGELKRLKSVAAIADRINAAGLKQDLIISEVSGDVSYKERVLDVKNLKLLDHDINLAFTGGIDLSKQKYVDGNRLTLRGSPAITQNLPSELSYFRDKSGWLELTFELKGDLKKPLPVPILEKPIEAVIGKLKVTIEAKKVELEQKASAEVKKLEEEAKRKAEEEKKRLEEEAKKKLIELIKF